MALSIESVFNIYTLVEVVWLILPAYAANGLVPLLGLYKGKLHQVDFGKKFRGKPLLGPGKSWEGLFLGSVLGVLIASIEMLAFPFLPFEISPAPLTIVVMTPLLGLLLGFGAMAGDIAGSFIKRRLGLERGSPAPILDQDDFVIGAFLFVSLIMAVRMEWWILLLVITPILHWIACAIGYILKVKKTPW